MFLSSKILMESIFNTNPTSNDKQLTISQEKIVIKHLLAWASLSPPLSHFFNLAKESEDITDAVLAVRGSLQNVGNALDDFVGGAKVLTVSPGL